MTKQSHAEAEAAWWRGEVNPSRITAALDVNSLYGPTVDTACGVAEPAVDLWESAELYPTWDQIRALSALTGYPESWFMRPTEIDLAPITLCGRRCETIEPAEHPTRFSRPIIARCPGTSAHDDDRPPRPPQYDSAEASAILSPDGKFRYWLQRALPATFDNCGSARRCAFVMLNPSTADATTDDPTLRRCLDFAAATAATSVEIVNLYGFRATNPAELDGVVDPVGPDNHHHVLHALSADTVIVAWGARAGLDQVAWFLGMAAHAGATLWSLGETKDGAPRHPLYVRAGTPLQPWPALDEEAR